MTTLSVHPSTPQARYIKQAVAVLRSGGVIIYPTDTVYGLGCSIFDPRAIERVYAIKHRNRSTPFSFMCSDLSHISDYAKVSNSAFRLMKHLIPGPYTFILRASRLKQLPRSMISNRQEVGIRVPRNETCRLLLKELGTPILNASVEDNQGELINSPDDIREKYEHEVDLMLDGGNSLFELSTILDLTAENPVIVRQGAGDTSQLRPA